MTDTSEREQAEERLKTFVREHRPGGCEWMTAGGTCQCPLCDIERLAALRPPTEASEHEDAPRWQTMETAPLGCVVVCHPVNGDPYVPDPCIYLTSKGERHYADKIAASRQRVADQGTTGNRYTVEPVGAPRSSERGEERRQTNPRTGRQDIHHRLTRLYHDRDGHSIQAMVDAMYAVLDATQYGRTNAASAPPTSEEA